MNPKTTPDIDLNVLQRGNLNFFTDNTQWMRLNAQGNLGLSDEWSTFTGPTEQLHQHKDRSASVWHHFTNGNTGFNSSQGFRTGLFFNPTFNWSEAHFEQWHYAPIITMLANSSGAYKERIKVWQGLGGDQVGGWANTPDITKISINHGLGNSGAVDYSPMPVCMLNIGRRGASGTQAGNRAWMDVGTYYNFDSDNMYVGLKDDGPNRKDAVINWGDDANAAPDQDFENLLFIFTNTNYNPGSIDSYDYNSPLGRMLCEGRCEGSFSRT